ncbi:cupredoxin domain-containing protein, partial [Natronomonas sp.]
MAHKRRTVLRGLGSAAIVGSVAGCIGDDTGADDEGSSPTDTDEPTATESDESTPTGDHSETTVTLVSNAFQPDFATIEAGTTVEFVVESGSHTVTAYHTDNDRQHRVPNGTEVFDVPMEEGERETPTFETEGVYDYHCKPHESVGMVGSILVGDAGSDANGLTEPDGSDLPEAAADAIRDLNDRAREELGVETEGGTAETETEGDESTETETDSDDGGGGYY